MTTLSVTLYSKPDCQLCDEVKQLLASLREEVAFVLEERNILDDPEAFDRFRYLIPVVEIGGGPLLYPPHDWMALRTALHGARRALRTIPHDLPSA